MVVGVHLRTGYADWQARGHDKGSEVVLHRTNGTECVSSVLWNGPRPSVAAFRALRAWYHHHGIPLPDARMLTDAERDLWEVSRMEA